MIGDEEGNGEVKTGMFMAIMSLFIDLMKHLMRFIKGVFEWVMKNF
jgi:hypothetical protein